MGLVRHRVAELMDDPAIDREQHRAALRGLARLNEITAIDRVIWQHMGPMAHASPRPLRVLDVATGSGDLPIRLARRARSEGLELELHGCDVSAVALECSREAAEREGVRMRVHVIDVLRDALPGDFDVAHCGLFLHHLDPPHVRLVLRRMSESAGRVLVQDLRRTWPGLAMAWLVPRLVTRSRVVHVDAVRSVHAAYTADEMREMASSAGLTGVRVWPIWPERLLLSWQRSVPNP